MVEHTSLSYAGRTLIVVLGMHRSGSSLVTNVLQRLGMSLGPFELFGGTEHNKYGHFESWSILEFNKELLNRVFGFPDDIPRSAEVLRQFRQGEGHWSLDDTPLPEELFDRGRGLIEPLVVSAVISGFKDPRVPLLWPYWHKVLDGFPGLRVIPVFLARSPHESAMSIFMRSKGRLDYNDALDVTAEHYRCLNRILESWKGPSALVRFDPRAFADDMRRAAKVCDLAWSDEILAQVYDSDCKHHEAASVAHPAEALFQRLGGLPAREHGDPANLEQLAHDAAAREGVMRSCIVELREEMQQLSQAGEQERQQQQLKELEYQRRLATVETQLARIRATRTWRWHDRMAQIPAVKWLASLLR